MKKVSKIVIDTTSEEWMGHGLGGGEREQEEWREGKLVHM